MSQEQIQSFTFGDVSRACSLCRRDHKACNGARPCVRCSAMGTPHLCEDIPLKKRGRPVRKKKPEGYVDGVANFVSSFPNPTLPTVTNIKVEAKTKDLSAKLKSLQQKLQPARQHKFRFHQHSCKHSVPSVSSASFNSTPSSSPPTSPQPATLVEQIPSSKRKLEADTCCDKMQGIDDSPSCLSLADTFQFGEATVDCCCSDNALYNLTDLSPESTPSCIASGGLFDPLDLFANDVSMLSSNPQRKKARLNEEAAQQPPVGEELTFLDSCFLPLIQPQPQQPPSWLEDLISDPLFTPFLSEEVQCSGANEEAFLFSAEEALSFLC